MRLKVTILPLFILSATIVFSGCTGETITTAVTTPTEGYEIYEIKADDIRFLWLNHPLYSFEYPKDFVLIDLNKMTSLEGVDLIKSKVEFMYEHSTLFIRLSVIVDEPFPGYLGNAIDKFNYLVSTQNSSDDIIIKKILIISGINAYYLEYFKDPEKIGRKNSSRVALFDYAGLIWEINMTTYSPYPEPKEVQEYFDHVIETFKILESSCANVPTGNELNVTISYENGVFTIINNEDFTLCEVKLFLNYVGDDLSTGYEYSDIYGIPSHQTTQIQDWRFENINREKYPEYQKPLKFLIQAEFPGCVNKTYSYLKTWE